MISILITACQAVSASPDSVPHPVKCLISSIVADTKEIANSERRFRFGNVFT